MFGKVFASLWQGSMVGKADVQLVFVYMLANCDADGFIDQSHDMMAALTGIPVERVRAAVTVLEEKDPASRTNAEGGRRIVRVDDHRDWGWWIVNHAMYRAMRDPEERKRQTRKATARWRAKRAGEVSSGEQLVIENDHREPIAEDRSQMTDRRRINVTSPERLNGGASGAETPTAGQGGRSPSTGGVRASGGENGARRGGSARVGKESEGAAVEEIVLADGTPWCPTVAEVEEWVRLFPGVEVAGEFRKMRAWCQANGKRRKTARGVRAFVVGWLTRAQDGGRGSGRQSGLATGPGDRMKVREATEYRDANTKS